MIMELILVLEYNILDDYGAYSRTIMELIPGGLCTTFQDDYGVYSKTIMEYIPGRLWSIFQNDYEAYSGRLLSII